MRVVQTFAPSNPLDRVAVPQGWQVVLVWPWDCHQEGQRALTHDGSPSWAFSDNRLTHGPTCQQVVVRPVPSGRVTPYRAAPRQDAQVSALPLWIAVTGLRRHGRLRWAPIM